jgi:dephospho-CoA kinase
MGHRGNLIIGLTGGIGCGKTTAAGMFAEHGFVRLDADQVVKEELLTDSEVISALAAKFGADVLTSSRQVDRAWLADVVFTDPAQLRWLEALLHPRLYARWRALFAASHGQKYIVEVPLLFEQGMENWFDFTICITSECASQIRRLESRGLPLKLARQRLAQQLPLARKCEMADFVILNDGSLEFLREQINLLAQRFLQHQPASPASL